MAALLPFLDYQFLKYTWIIANHTVTADLACALYCNRKKNCLGFNYRRKTKVNAVNCQLTNCPVKEHIQVQRGGDSSWIFFQAPYLFSVSHSLKFIKYDIFRLYNYRYLPPVPSHDAFTVESLIYRFIAIYQRDINLWILCMLKEKPRCN